jgi:hypothetical protein
MEMEMVAKVTGGLGRYVIIVRKRVRNRSREKSAPRRAAEANNLKDVRGQGVPKNKQSVMWCEEVYSRFAAMFAVSGALNHCRYSWRALFVNCTYLIIKRAVYEARNKINKQRMDQ